MGTATDSGGAIQGDRGDTLVSILESILAMLLDVALEMLCELSSAYFRDQSLLENEVHLMYLILLPVPAKDLVINISTYAGMVAEFCRSLAGPNLCRCWDNSRATTIWM